MLDFLHLPKPQNGYIDYFPGFSTSSGGQWEVWNKPRGISFIKIITIGGGGGGRSGWVASTSTRSGGGGGGSAGVTHVTIPAIFLPDRLYVSSGRGGPGGASATTLGTATAGADGASSYVCIAQSTAAIYTVCFGNSGFGAVLGTAVGGTGGVAGAVATQANALMSAQGNFTALAGQAGSAGNTSTGTAVTYPITGLLLSGGACGGGGSASASPGQNITAPTQTVYNIFPTVTGGESGVTFGNSGFPGATGVENFQLLLSTGGAGGGACGTTTAGAFFGGAGGSAGFGSGGGGGGAGPATSGSGAGGNGGPGLVIISCW
jgi:hypothetical protein